MTAREDEREREKITWQRERRPTKMVKMLKGSWRHWGVRRDL